MPDPGDDDAPQPVDADATFYYDAQTVSTCYYYLDRFGQAPDVTLRQDELLMEDISRMDKQVKFREWCRMKDLDPDDAPEGYPHFDASVPSWRDVFGVTVEAA